LVVGLAGTGEQVAARANAFGMRVIALDDRATEKPDAVFKLGKLEALQETLPLADVVVLALPLTETTRPLIGATQLQAMKKGALLVNAAHTALVDLKALGAELARSDNLGGAGLDTTDVGPLPEGEPLATSPRVVLTAHAGEPGPEAQERQW